MAYSSLSFGRTTDHAPKQLQRFGLCPVCHCTEPIINRMNRDRCVLRESSFKVECVVFFLGSEVCAYSGADMDNRGRANKIQSSAKKMGSALRRLPRGGARVKSLTGDAHSQFCNDNFGEEFTV